MPVFRPAPFEPVELDVGEAQRAREARQRRLNVTEIPRLRIVGFSFLAVGVLMHDRLILPVLGWSGWLGVTVTLEAYALLAWVALWLFYDRVKPIDLGLVFLVVDLAMIDFAIWATGGEHSWFFFVLCARVADQSHTSVRRALLFAQLAPLSYVLLLGWLVGVEGRTVALAPEAAKLVFIWGLSLYMAVTAMVSEQRRARTATAIRVARDLISELQAQSRQLEEARLRAETANDAKSRFLAAMSHELRTPLNAIIGFSQVLAGRAHGDLTAAQVAFVDSIVMSGRHLLGLVNDILDLAKVEAGRFELHRTRFDAAQALEEALRTVEPLARDKGLDVALTVDRRPAEIDADPAKFRQIVLNLVTNAIKFTPPLGHLKVRATRATHGTDGARREVLRVSVADTGIGIRPADQARIFEAFEQVDSSTARQQTGTGLGLALTRRLVELHGGRIWVESEGVAGRGSVFTFEMPIAA